MVDNGGAGSNMAARTTAGGSATGCGGVGGRTTACVGAGRGAMALGSGERQLRVTRRRRSSMSTGRKEKDRVV